VGEKVLATSSTFNNQVLFTTYKPECERSSDPCTTELETTASTRQRFRRQPRRQSEQYKNLSYHRSMDRAGAERHRTWGNVPVSAPQPGVNGNPPPPNQQPVVCMSGAEVLASATISTAASRPLMERTGAN